MASEFIQAKNIIVNNVIRPSLSYPFAIYNKLIETRPAGKEILNTFL